MTFKTKVILIFTAITLLSAGLCWSIYRSTTRIEEAFTTFTEEDIYTLHHLFQVRANLSEHERLLYEYYATQSRTPILIRLALVRRSLERDLTFLKRSLNSSRDFKILQATYTGYSEELDRLDEIMQEPATDWDAARASLVRLSGYGQQAGPALDNTFELVSGHSEQTQEQVQSKLEQMTLSVFGFVSITLIAAFTIGYATREALRIDVERRRLAFFPERSPNPTFSLTHDGKIIYANPSSYRLAALIDKNLPSVLPPDIKQRIHNLRNSSNQSIAYEYRLHDHVLLARLQLLKDLDQYHLYINDVTDRSRAEEKLRLIAYHDGITGLPNRRSFMLECEKWTYEQGFTFSVVMIGFLRFEQTARNVGQEIIDELLKQVACHLNTILSSVTGSGVHTARLYRLYGAYYVMLLRPQRDADLRLVTERVAESVLSDLSVPLNIRRREIWLHPAIGASFCPDDGVIPAELVAGAGAAQGQLVQEHRRGYQPLIPKFREVEKSWLEMEAALRLALEKGEFCLYYQPKVSAVDGRLCGVEALVRWNRNDHGLVPPGSFIPIAEESGLIVPLGAWIMHESCRQATVWRDTDQSNFSIAVNVSKLQFQQPDFIPQVQNTLQKHNLEAFHLELEITESMLMEDLDCNIAKLNKLHELGVTLALDDFGTGYSSLEYLSRFPVTRLKIDRSFVTNLITDPRIFAIVRSMIDLAHNLGITVTAEGVETEEQLTALRKLGCDELQGYYFSRPLEPEALVTWWHEYRKTILNSRAGFKVISKAI